MRGTFSRFVLTHHMLINVFSTVAWNSTAFTMQILFVMKKAWDFQTYDILHSSVLKYTYDSQTQLNAPPESYSSLEKCKLFSVLIWESVQSGMTLSKHNFFFLLLNSLTVFLFVPFQHYLKPKNNLIYKNSSQFHQLPSSLYCVLTCVDYSTFARINRSSHHEGNFHDIYFTSRTRSDICSNTLQTTQIILCAQHCDRIHRPSDDASYPCMTWSILYGWLPHQLLTTQPASDHDSFLQFEDTQATPGLTLIKRASSSLVPLLPSSQPQTPDTKRH